MKSTANRLGSFLGIAFTAFLLLTSAFALSDNSRPTAKPASCVKSEVAPNGGDQASISGKVLDASGRSVALASVILEDEHGRRIEIRSDKAGCFIASGISTGAVYHVETVHKSGVWAASVRTFENGDQILLQAADLR